jgi:hypothetical protein
MLSYLVYIFQNVLSLAALLTFKNRKIDSGVSRALHNVYMYTMHTCILSRPSSSGSGTGGLGGL